MTQQEKQEIIEAVLEALQTNSLSISQMTPVTELIDSDMFEVSGGRRILFANLVQNVMAKGVVNDLTTGGEADALSAEMGKILKRNVNAAQSNIQRLYTKLANMAFWDSSDQANAEPSALNWDVPMKTITFDLSGVGDHVVVKMDNDAVINYYPTDVGSTHTLTIEAAEDYVLNNDVAVEVNGVVQTLTNVGGVYSLQVTVNDNMAIEVVGTATRFWFLAPKDDEVSGGSVVRYGMQQGRSIHATTGNTTSGMLANNTTPAVILSPAGVPTTTKVFTSNILPGGNYVYGDPGNTAPYFFPTGGKRYLHVILGGVDVSNAEFYVAVGCFGNAVIGQTYVQSENVTGYIGRIAYSQGNVSTLVWKIDLDAFATDSGASAGDITYIKLLFSKMVGGQNEDSRLWYGGLTVKYRFSDD